jgi:biopolymer transport protein ExbD
MSSMTDVVFLLLIFFMIASTLAKQLNTIDVKLPKAEGKSENRNTVAVSIKTAHRFYIDEQSIQKTNLEQALLRKMKSLSSPSVILRADKNVPLEDVVYVMNISNRNGIKIVLAVDAQ